MPAACGGACRSWRPGRSRPSPPRPAPFGWRRRRPRVIRSCASTRTAGASSPDRRRRAPDRDRRGRLRRLILDYFASAIKHIAAARTPWTRRSPSHPAASTDLLPDNPPQFSRHSPARSGHRPRQHGRLPCPARALSGRGRQVARPARALVWFSVDSFVLTCPTRAWHCPAGTAGMAGSGPDRRVGAHPSALDRGRRRWHRDRLAGRRRPDLGRAPARAARMPRSRSGGRCVGARPARAPRAAAADPRLGAPRLPARDRQRRRRCLAPP